MSERKSKSLFERSILLEAHRRAAAAGVEATDEAALVEWAGHAVRVVPGPQENLKVTTAADTLQVPPALPTP